jgi:hypothetical protein
MIAEGFEDLSSNHVNKYPTFDLSHMSTKTQLLNEALKEKTESTHSTWTVEITQSRK